MARSVLGSFVSGTRQMLAAQLFISVGAVGLAGWTLAVTNDLIRERARLNERVIQLEETLAANNIVVPETATVVDPAPPATTEDAYPPPGAPDATVLEPAPAEGAAAPADPASPASEPAPPPPATEERGFNPAVLFELFMPPPPMRTVVLHARTEADAEVARRVGAELATNANVSVAVMVMQPRDARESEYSYFDGRQSRAAANIVQQFHDIARRGQIAPWSAQLRGVALPAQGEFTADRLDIVLPPLPAPGTRTFDPRLLQEGYVIRQQQPQPQQPVIR